MSSNTITISILSVLSLILLFLLKHLLGQKKKKQLEKAFIVLFTIHILWMIGLILQIIFVNKYNLNPIYFDYFVYVCICFSPVVFFFIAMIFSKTKIKWNNKYLLLFIIPVISLLLLWTNDKHHLFYEKYTTNFNESVYGKYFNIHFYYTMILYLVSLVILLKYSIKNSGFFSRKAILITIGAAVPLATNLIGTLGLISISIYATPITFVVTIICLTLAMFRFDLLKVAPIALQRIVDVISDSYIIIDEYNIITDFNQTLLETFKLSHSSDIRGKNLKTFLISNELSLTVFESQIKKIEDNDKTTSFDVYLEKLDKTLNVEITSIVEKKQFLGILILFKDITEHVKDMEKIKDAQESLMESERLSSLGQLIGGIAHNLKTPIMSISGATEGLRELIDEYDKSIGVPDVTNEDYHEIAGEMNDWIVKIKSYTEYMSDIITAVRGQAMTLSASENISFTIEDLIKRVTILMNHELKSAHIDMNVNLNGTESTIIKGDINSLVQVINNMISNSIQSYDQNTEGTIELNVSTNSENIFISVKDYGCGLPDNVKDKLFKEMITTKGKNGTGLGMYMSYSTIKANFNGTITYESEKDKGTTFTIIIPLTQSE